MRGKPKKITKKMLREFWKHGLNPITGFRCETRDDTTAYKLNSLDTKTNEKIRNNINY